MTAQRTRRRSARLATIGYILLAAATAAAFYVTWNNAKPSNEPGSSASTS
jgi:hypothetical protein